jgi:hypothetical protein
VSNNEHADLGGKNWEAIQLYPKTRSEIGKPRRIQIILSVEDQQNCLMPISLRTCPDPSDWQTFAGRTILCEREGEPGAETGVLIRGICSLRVGHRIHRPTEGNWPR